jgi:hypothetical protein
MNNAMKTKIYILADEHRRKISKAHVGTTAWNKGKTGAYKTDERKPRGLPRGRSLTLETNAIGKSDSEKTNAMVKQCLISN